MHRVLVEGDMLHFIDEMQCGTFARTRTPRLVHRHRGNDDAFRRVWEFGVLMMRSEAETSLWEPNGGQNGSELGGSPRNEILQAGAPY